MTDKLDQIYLDAKKALEEKEFDLAADYLRQILLEDHDFKDASRLLAQVIKLKRRRWFNDPRVLGIFVFCIFAAILYWILPNFKIQKTSLSDTTTSPTITTEPVSTQTPSQTATMIPTPTSIPLAWKRISLGQEFPKDNVTSIAVDHNDPDIIFVSMLNSGIYKSINGGVSWSPALNGLDSPHVTSLLMDPVNSGILYAGTTNGVYKTQDSGLNWSWVGEGSRLLMDQQNNAHLYAYRWGDIFESFDMGESWVLVHQEYKCPNLWNWAINPQNGSNLYGTVRANFGGCTNGVYESLDGGHSWELKYFEGIDNISSIAVVENMEGEIEIHVESGQIILENGEITSNPLENDCSYFNTNQYLQGFVFCKIYAGMKLFRPDQPMLRITKTTSVQEINAFNLDTYHEQTRIIVGGQGLIISTDNGKTWAEQSSGIGFARSDIKIDPSDPTRIFLSTSLSIDEQVCDLFRSTDGGVNWANVVQGQHISRCEPIFDADGNIYILINDTLIKSSDGGTSWVSLNLPTLQNNDDRIYTISVNPYIGDFSYAASGFMFYSHNGGNSWQMVMDIEETLLVNGRLYFAEEGNKVYSAGSSVFYSTDAGVTWNFCEERQMSLSNSDSRMLIDPNNSNHLYAASIGEGVLISYDGCKNWKRSNVGIKNLNVNSLALDPNSPDTVYAGTDSGAYISYDAGHNWHEINDGLLGVTVIYSIAVDQDSNAYAATPYGVFKLINK